MEPLQSVKERSIRQTIQESNKAAVKARNQRGFAWFSRFWVSCDEELGLDRALCQRMEAAKFSLLIPNEYITDGILQFFINYCWQYILRKKLLTKPNMRPMIGYISWCLRMHNMGISLSKCAAKLPKAALIWNRIQENPLYKEYKSEKAPVLEGDDEERIKCMALYDSDGEPLRWNIFRRICHEMMKNAFLRKQNVHSFRESMVSIEYNMQTGRLTLYVRTEGDNKQKHADNDEVHGFECICVSLPTDDTEEWVDGHNPINCRCIITVAFVYSYWKRYDMKHHCKPKHVNWDIAHMNYGELYYFRKKAWIDHKDHKKGCYITLNRIGPSKITNVLADLNKQLDLSISRGTNKSSNRNKRRKDFVSHSNKRTMICNTERDFGDRLTDHEKKILGAGSWNHYADDGMIAKKRTISKLSGFERESEMNRLYQNRALAPIHASDTTASIPPSVPSSNASYQTSLYGSSVTSSMPSTSISAASTPICAASTSMSYPLIARPSYPGSVASIPSISTSSLYRGSVPSISTSVKAPSYSTALYPKPSYSTPTSMLSQGSMNGSMLTRSSASSISAHRGSQAPSLASTPSYSTQSNGLMLTQPSMLTQSSVSSISAHRGSQAPSLPSLHDDEYQRLLKKRHEMQMQIDLLDQSIAMEERRIQEKESIKSLYGVNRDNKYSFKRYHPY